MKARLPRIWIAVLLLAFLGGLIGGLPARVALRFAPEVGARLSDIEGSLWHGHARLPFAGVEAAALEWRLSPASLLLGAPRFALALRHPLAEFDGALVLRGGSVEVAAGELRTSLSPLARVAGLPPGTLLGNVNVQGISATLDADGVRSLVCSGAISSVTVTADAAPLALGDLALSCEDAPGGPTIGIADRGGPLALEARIALAQGWRYLIDGSAGARPGAPASLVEALPLLGRADGPDRVRFRYTGSFEPR
jgi:hypothetical protein